MSTMSSESTSVGTLEAVFKTRGSGAAKVSEWREAWRIFVNATQKTSPDWGCCAEVDLSKTLDEYAAGRLAHSDSNKVSPRYLMRQLNPLTVSEHLGEGLQLLSACNQRRAEAFALEAQLFAVGLDYELAEKNVESVNRLNKLGVRANSKTSQESAVGFESDVDAIAQNQEVMRNFMRTMSSVKGSPLNLCERLDQARDDYVNALAILIAKAELVRITLRASFSLSEDVVSPLTFVTASAGTLSKLKKWFRDLNLILEHLRSRERVVTLYRLVRAEAGR